MRYRSGFILLEAMVGVALFTLVMMLVLQSTLYISTQCRILQERHSALCEAIYTREWMRKGGVDKNLFFKEHTVSRVDVIDDLIMPYTHPSVRWCAITAARGSQSVILHCAEYEHAS
jgi:hypothetical protein